MSESGRHTAVPALPPNFARACVLALISEAPAHGYEILKRLRAAGANQLADSALYRHLRALEEEGLVWSQWHDSDVVGPRRRVYRLTNQGVERLRSNAEDVVMTLGHIDAYLRRYERLAVRRTAAA